MNLPILMYHELRYGVPRSDLEITPAAFQAQMNFLRQAGFQSLDLAELAGLVQGRQALPAKPVVITFDDAYLSVWKYAKPILDAAGFTATVFAVSEAVGKNNFWDERPGWEPRNCLDAGQLRHLAAAGWEIGSHGARHVNLTQADAAERAVETAGSRQALSGLLGRPVEVFAYPFGAWNAAGREAVARAGYTAACAISPGTASVCADLLALRRVYVKPSDSLGAFKRKISSWYLAYRAWRKR